MIKNKNKINKKGSVLILVFWALGLLTVFAIYLGFGSRTKIDFLDRMAVRSKTFYLAQAGIKQAIAGIGNIDKKKSYISLNDICSNKDKMFSQIEFDGAVVHLGYEYSGNNFSSGGDITQTMYGVFDEQSKLNINTVERKELISLLVETSDLNFDRADEIASAIIDWRDENFMSLAKGAEDKYYHSLQNSYECKDYEFETIEELRYVKGMDYNIFIEIEPYITVYSSGLININTASSNVLKALGLSDKLIDKILSFRCGDDEIETTDDDKIFENISSSVAILSQSISLSASEVAQLSNLVASGRFTVFSNKFLIQSQANLKNSNDVCRIKCIFEKDMNEDAIKPGFILSWRMGYLKR